MLPAKYAWLAQETGPKMIVEAVKLYGLLEKPGPANNPVILAMAKEVGLDRVYTADSIAWCGLFMAVVAKRAGKDVPKDPLWALNWRKFGRKVDRPMLGDVLTKNRKGGGHVTLYVGEDATHYHCLGGNQSDSVNITRVAKTESWGFNRPLYNTQPANVRVVKLSASGAATGGSEA